ncbi:hypothetical protein J3458_022131 [Metarhizium acridum]|uniref:uncharacterized protein n=1 Tax=Metarhizium acridum TaxID=92637 RepID=UPI001C6BF343|nr:hypothetical protein J3458_022131 [Metarhizium acridum]
MSSNPQETNAAENNGDEQSAGARQIRQHGDQFMAVTTTEDLAGTMRELFSRSGVGPDVPLTFHLTNITRLRALSVTPPPFPRKFSEFEAEVRLDQEEAEKEIPCGNCLTPGHKVRDCVHPADDGFVHGCPVCNKADHESADGCNIPWPQRPKKLSWAIERRAHRPTLATFANWVDMFIEAKEAGDTALPQNFPWTPSFCKSLMEHQTQPWTMFDYAKNDLSDLPKDPETADQDTVMENLAWLRDIPSCVDRIPGGNPWVPLKREPDEEMFEPESHGMEYLSIVEDDVVEDDDGYMP